MNSSSTRENLSAFEAESQAFKNKLTKDEEYALSKYMSLSFEYINPILREETGEGQFFDNEFNNQNSHERAQELIPKIDSALAKHIGKKKHLTYRAFTVKGKQNVDEYIASHYKIGDTVSDKAYLSTAADPDYLLLHNEFSHDRMFVFEILGKNGVPVHTINAEEYAASPSNYEREVLYPRNTKFKVVGITQNTYESSYDKYAINRIKSFFYNFSIKKATYSVVQLMEI